MDNMNTNQMNRNGSAIKFIYPAFIMMAVQLLVQLFAGQLMFFYKGYKYTEGTAEEFFGGYMASLSSDKFTLLVSILSTLILTVVFLFWYRSEIIHAANVSLRQKMKISEFAELFGTNPDTIRYYVNMGLLVPRSHNKRYDRNANTLS